MKGEMFRPTIRAIGVCVALATHPPAFAEATKSARARAVGEVIGERAKAAGIDAIVFDRGGYLYHGRVKAVAEGARAAGLTF